MNEFLEDRLEEIKNNQILQIDIKDLNIGAKGALKVAQTILENSNSSLISICLSNNDIGDPGAQAIADMLKINHSLASINLALNNIGTEGAKAIANALKVNQSLQNIRLEWNYIGNQGAEAIIDALNVNNSLQNIEIWNNGIDGYLSEAIDELIRKNVEILNKEKKWLSVCLFVEMAQKKGKLLVLDVLKFELFPLLGFFFLKRMC